MRLSGALCIMALSTSCGLAQQPSDDRQPQGHVASEDDGKACDSSGFIEAAIKAEEIRKNHKLTSEKFVKFASEPNTIVLDARGENAYRHLHVKGSINLPYTAFSQESLQRVIPSKTTRVLIYCRNNFKHIPVDSTVIVQSLIGTTDLDVTFAKGQSAGLNIPTFITLYIYGYRDVWELDAVVNLEKTSIEFEGAHAEILSPDEPSRAPKSQTVPVGNATSTPATR